ncbi:hypothetical protein FRX31_016691 [Thalictrum thalictroides]|uniref:Uncharacterized protein n=1 Tax=Thalictrum thalictroides TaxID=46969 RepID=A0A7J6WBZ2_THATH|nr:hypothetical protein FRX31_016691 [Thalictrum thalictroides]
MATAPQRLIHETKDRIEEVILRQMSSFVNKECKISREGNLIMKQGQGKGWVAFALASQVLDGWLFNHPTFINPSILETDSISYCRISDF